MTDRLPDLPARPVTEADWLAQSLGTIQDSLKAIYTLQEKLMTQNDEISAALGNVESLVTTLLPEIQSEIQDLAAQVAANANAMTPDQAQAVVDRLNALGSKVSDATASLQGDNPPPPAPPAQAHRSGHKG